MPTPALSLPKQMLRRRPVSGAPVVDGASITCNGSLGTFLLTMFGVGETVGAGIFIVLSQSVPQAGPAVVISFMLAGIAAGLAAVCYAEMASAVPISGSAYSYCYATLGELANGRRSMPAARVRRIHRGGGGRVESVSEQAAGQRRRISPTASYFGGAVGFRAGCHQPAGHRLSGDVCGPVDSRSVIREGQRRHGGDQARRAGDIRGYRVHRVQSGPLQ